MKEILEKYSTRLVNVGGRNRSLVTKKLPKKRSFDIVKLNEFDERISENVLGFLKERSEKELQIIEDPYKWYTDEYNILKAEIDEEKDKAIEDIKNTTVFSEKDIEDIEERYSKRLEEADDKLRKRQEKLIGYITSIKTLVKEIKSTEKETGRYEFYIGYPFVEGYFKDKTFTKAPLFLFPIEVIKRGDKWYLKNKLDSNVLLNKVFLIGYAKYNEEKLVNIETEYNDLTSFNEDLIDGIINRLKDVNINISYDGHDITRFKEITKDTELNYNPGELVIKNNMIMGHFNIANSIYNDYKEMESKNLSNKLMDTLLKNTDISEGSQGDGSEIGFNKDIKEKDFYFISDLDYSQEIAVKKAYENSQLVIYGPPGTGKSQTIVNIVSQYLSQGKKVLMVSQKKAALDVIFNRSSSINSKMIMFNKDTDKKQFYRTISNRLDSLEKKPLSNEKIKSMANIVDERIDKLKNLGDVLTKEIDFGLTIHELYTKERISTNNDDLNNFFRVFRKEYPFEDLKYEELVSISNTVLENDKASKFYRLKNIMVNNKYSLYLKENIDIYDLEDSIKEIVDLINDYEGLLKHLMLEVKYFSDSKNIAIKNFSLNEVAKRINENENGHLLNKLTNGSKFSIGYWINLKKNKAKEEENLILFDKKQNEIVRILEVDVSKIKDITGKFTFLSDVLITEKVDEITESFENKEKVLENLKLILDVLNKHNEIILLKGTVNDIKEDQIRVLDYVYSKEKDFDKAYDILRNLPNLANQVHIGRVQREYARELETVENFEAIRKEIASGMESKRKEVPKYINQKWDNIALENKISNEKLWKSMQREIKKKSKLMPIRGFVSTFENCIFDLYPCWLLSPEKVSELLPLVEGLFDVIIFDEASQMFIETAIPTIYRGEKVIVAGDDKQLRPSSDFSSKYDDEEEEYDIETSAALEEESLLDLAKYSFDSTSLYYHYRSQFDELINFSNYAFYGGKLEVSPNIYKTNIENSKPIERIKVDGKWVDRTNPKEAMEVVKLVKDILNNRKNNETIGVITFNITQKDLIDNLLEIEASKDQDFGKKYFAEVDRVEKNEDISLFIKNIENVQGDERDIIIFSTAYARNEKDKVVANFGSLSRDGGENRLNVAISRAKKKIYVVTSIEPEELNVDISKNNGPKLFKKYLQYVKAVSEGNKDTAKDILYSLSDSQISRNEEIHYDSDFENQVHDALQNAGLIVDTQIGVSGYKIDLGVYDKDSSKYILGIECDGAAYNSSKSARERDIYRQRYLESRGWNIIRIWSKDWWSNPQKEVDKIVERVNELQNKKEKIITKGFKVSDNEIENIETLSIKSGIILEDPIIKHLLDNEIEYVDKRDKGGSLWVVGGIEFSDFMNELEKSIGVKFIFTDKGGKATNYKPGWYLK